MNKMRSLAVFFTLIFGLSAFQSAGAAETPLNKADRKFMVKYLNETKKDMLKARAQAAQAQAQLQGAVGGLNTDSAMAAFDRMEEKVLSLEARGQAAAELAGADLDSRFQALEAGGDVDQELAALKASLSPTPLALPDDSKKPELLPAQAAEVDDELEKLKRSIDNL